MSDDVVKVKLANSKVKATVDRADYEELMQLGVSPRWIFAQGQVCVTQKRRPVSVARMILDAGEGHKVRFLDQNQLNLRRSNLALDVGTGKYRALDKVQYGVKDRVRQLPSYR